MNKVDEERDGAVGYYSIIKKPMWMNLIMQKFENTKKAHNHPEVKVEEGEVYQDATGFFDRRGERKDGVLDRITGEVFLISGDVRRGVGILYLSYLYHYNTVVVLVVVDVSV